ncbi:MAG: hypothetical protein HRT43_08515 [Campylobacteraceae bacterium]|nr:hypothetical protein [Campylobacteraceae bacterium]
MKNNILIFFITLFALQISSFANEADVLNVKYSCTPNRTCTFDVTIKHQDTGWKHYANAFEVLTPTKQVLSKRILRHPHVNEQPFTRSISGVRIPPNVNMVVIRAHDLVHKYGGRQYFVRLKF